MPKIGLVWFRWWCEKSVSAFLRTAPHSSACRKTRPVCCSLIVQDKNVTRTRLSEYLCRVQSMSISPTWPSHWGRPRCPAKILRREKHRILSLEGSFQVYRCFIVKAAVSTARLSTAPDVPIMATYNDTVQTAGNVAIRVLPLPWAPQLYNIQRS